VPKGRKKQKHFAPKPNPALKLKNHENDGNKNEKLDLNPCLTSTPKGTSYKENNPTSPFLSPILHNVDEGHGSKAIDEIIKEEKKNYHGSVSLSEPYIHTANARRNILPEMHQFGPSCKTSNLLSAPSVVEGNVSSSLYKISVHKLESLDVTAGAVLADSENETKDVPSQLHSCKVDERTVSTMANSDQLHVMCSELRNLKESFTCKDQKCDSPKQLFMNDSVNGVSTNGCFVSSPVHQCENINLTRQKNRGSKCKERTLYKCDDSDVEDFLGFSDVPPVQDLCKNTGRDVLSNLYPAGDSNQFSTINECPEICKVSPSKSRNMSVILFDSWVSVSGRTLEATPESKVCDQNQVLKSGVLISHSQRLLYPDYTGRHCAQDSAVQNSKEGSLHINDAGSHPTQESSVFSRNAGLLCSNVPISLLLQESSVDTDESHIGNQRGHPTRESTVYNTHKDELLCTNVSKNHVLQESSFLNSSTGESHIDHPRSLPS
jgi:hypothetical protein